MDDLLVLRCPPKSFFDDGPPAYLKRFLEQLHGADGKLAAGRQKRDALVMEARVEGPRRVEQVQPLSTRVQAFRFRSRRSVQTFRFSPL